MSRHVSYEMVLVMIIIPVGEIAFTSVMCISPFTSVDFLSVIFNVSPPCQRFFLAYRHDRFSRLRSLPPLFRIAAQTPSLERKAPVFASRLGIGCKRWFKNPDYSYLDDDICCPEVYSFLSNGNTIFDFNLSVLGPQSIHAIMSRKVNAGSQL